MFKAFLEFILYVLLIALLGAPFLLVVRYPELAGELVEISKTLIPWLVVLIISVIYVDGIRNLISKLASTLSRVTKLSAGGAAVELHPQDVTSNLTPEQAETIKVAIQNLSNEKQDATNLASHFFLKFVGSTIYGSQFSFLEKLCKSPLDPNQAISFYNKFVASVSKDTDYPFDKWAKYLTENFLIQFNANSGKYEITQAGQNFVTQAMNANLNSTSWPN